jgi:molybdate transport system ATP-binding protein
MLLQDIKTDQLQIEQWEMQPDQCWAVLARNGSGKQMLTGVITGESLLNTGSVTHNLANIGVLSFETQQALYEHELKIDDSDFMDRLDPGTTVRDLLELEGDIPEELAFLNLGKILDRGYRLLSSGESRKTLLAQTILAKPDFLILDEPYDSLDIASRTELQAFFAHLLEQGNTRLLFLFNKADELSDWHTHVAVIERGEMIIQGEKASVMADHSVNALLSFDPVSLPPWPEDLPRQELENPLVRLQEGKVQYGETVIFDDLDLHLNQGDHTLLTGPNGSGKSTLLDLITGDHPQCYGNTLDVLGFRRGSGESIWEVKKQIGIVSPGLHRNHRVPGSALHITLSGFFDSIGLYAEPGQHHIDHARQWLALVGLEESISVPFKQLSYGEQRLVLVARALVKQPALLILDEPTQGLDDINRHRIMYFLEHLSSQQRTTIIMASHRLDERLPLFHHHVDLA